MSQAVQNVKCLVLALYLAVFFFLLVWLAMGVHSISLSSSRRGFTLPLVLLFPWPFLHSKSAESSKISWEGWDMVAVEFLSSPCSVQWRNADEQPHNYCHQPNELFRYRGSPGWWWWGKWTAQRCTAIFKTQLSGPQGSDQVLRKWVNHLRLV